MSWSGRNEVHAGLSCLSTPEKENRHLEKLCCREKLFCPSSSQGGQACMVLARAFCLARDGRQNWGRLKNHRE
jgi:hypothetical protein